MRFRRTIRHELFTNFHEVMRAAQAWRDEFMGPPDSVAGSRLVKSESDGQPISHVAPLTNVSHPQNNLPNESTELLMATSRQSNSPHSVDSSMQPPAYAPAAYDANFRAAQWL